MSKGQTQEIVKELTPGNGAGGTVTADCEMVPDADIPKFRIPPEAPSLSNGDPAEYYMQAVGSPLPITIFEIIEPIENHVFIRPDQSSTMSSSGRLHLPDSVKETKPERGEVLYVGPGIEVEGKFNSTKINIGDRVIFHRHSGTEVTVNNEELVCMRENGVFGVIRELPVPAARASSEDTNETS